MPPEDENLYDLTIDLETIQAALKQSQTFMRSLSEEYGLSASLAAGCLEGAQEYIKETREAVIAKRELLADTPDFDKTAVEAELAYAITSVLDKYGVTDAYNLALTLTEERTS